jgi:hypothetical protein
VRSAERGSFAAIRRGQEKRLKSLLNYEGEDNFECFFGPSGSDLAYLPLMFARMLHPERPIVNLLTCPEELGSGTLLAAEGKYFMAVNQFGEATEYRGAVHPGIATEVVRFAARDADGNINDHRRSIRTAIESHPGCAVVGSLVIGSKSGIEDNVDVVHEAPDGALWVVDLCQFRNSKRLIKKLLDLGCMVMVTGSKFYESPPFCGVMLLPQPLVARLRDRDGSAARMCERIFTAEDCPESLPRIREHLRSYRNYGLLARWECAIAEMEAFDSYPVEVTQGIIGEWNERVVSEMRRRDAFELIPNQEITNPTIVSFRLRSGNRCLERAELDAMFKRVVLGRHEGFLGFNRVTIGQPVNYGDKSFIRIAIGAHGLRNLMDSPPGDRYVNDLRLLDLLQDEAARAVASG